MTAIAGMKVHGSPVNAVQYALIPFTDFDKVTTKTSLKNLNLSWTERDLPERLRTKHVHRLHPYLGKFVPQLVEIFLRKYRPKVICDPFCGSGTTSVVAKKLNRNFFGIEKNLEYGCYTEKRLELAEKDKTIQGYSEGVFWERNTLALQQKNGKGKTHKKSVREELPQETLF